MPFVRTKIIRGIEYHYLVENRRVDGKHRQIVLAYLGQHGTIRAAYMFWQEQVKEGQDAAARKHAREMVAKLKPYLD